MALRPGWHAVLMWAANRGGVAVDPPWTFQPLVGRPYPTAIAPTRCSLACTLCSSLPQFRVWPCLTPHPWATNSLPHGHLQTHQSLPFDGSALSTVIPVVLIVLPNIKASRGSTVIMTLPSKHLLDPVFISNMYVARPAWTDWETHRAIASVPFVYTSPARILLPGWIYTLH